MKLSGRDCLDLLSTQHRGAHAPSTCRIALSSRGSLEVVEKGVWILPSGDRTHVCVYIYIEIHICTYVYIDMHIMLMYLCDCNLFRYKYAISTDIDFWACRL